MARPLTIVNFLQKNKLRLFIVIVLLGNALFMENHLVNIKRAYEKVEDSELCEGNGTQYALGEYRWTQNRLSYGYGEIETVLFMAGFLYALYDPNGLRERKEAREKSDMQLKQLSRELEKIKQETDEKRLNILLKKVKGLDIHSFKPSTYELVLNLLQSKPLNNEVRDSVLEFCVKASTGFSYYGRKNRFRSDDLYNCVLNTLEKYPQEKSLKAYCLEVGRWHYSQRKMGIYDEQAIQNDIAAHS